MASAAVSNCCVKVGVRIRPLLSKERHQNCTLGNENHTRNTISFKSQQYTFDHVFGMDLSQQDLYHETAAPMLKSFLEGYNVTIMAYGQTGSGKTFTMGTSELQEESELQGLIPRFVTDLFENLKLSKSASDLSDVTDAIESERKTNVLISFLEIYGEDVYDLIGTTKTSSERPSLPVREDEMGHVFVQGQHEVQASSAHAALELLTSGTRNRITASTAMNSGSSRSHAVFTISLSQEISGSEEHDVHHMVSKLTFVDLAGSERIKRTGAEGQRLKEGIQINSGLFNLGQVINALADDQRIKQGQKAAHVPYRNSKLTHLLKDALGGNSQTLFLACVSPAESNESETHSTLNYARQARNIQNKPVKNMDKQQLEVRRLKYAVKAWMINACKHMFGLSNTVQRQLEDGGGGFSRSAALMLSPLPNVSPAAKGGKEDEILRRPEVQDYINAVNAMISEKLRGGSEEATAIIRRLSVGTPPRHAYSGHSASRRTHGDSSVVQRLAMERSDLAPGSMPCIRENEELDDDETGFRSESLFGDGHAMGNHGRNHHRESVLHTMSMRDSMFEATAPEETERLVTRMLEMVNKEKEMYVQDNKEIQGDIEIVAVDRAIEEKEQILTKLMDTVKDYSAMKADFEWLLEAIGGLETERHDLELELERAKKAADGGSSSAACPAAVERIKERYQKVKKELDDMREERKKKENAYRLMQKESKQCDALSKELKKLKESKVSMLKQQKAQQVHFQKRQRESQQKVALLKKSDVKKQQQMNTLKSELVKKDRVLGHKDREIGRINSKLRACEDHIEQLLRIQNRNRARLTSVCTPSGKAGNFAEGGRAALPPAELEHLLSSKAMLDNLITDRVERHLMKRLYEHKSASLQGLNREMLSEALEMEALLARLKVLGAEPTDEDEDEEDDEAVADDVKEEKATLRREVKVCEASIDRIARELDLYNADLDDLSDRMDESNKNSKVRGDKGNSYEAWEELGREIIAGFSLAQCQPLLWDLLGEKADALESARAWKEDLSQAREQAETNQERIAELEKQLQQCKSDMTTRLERAEMQRVQDVWAVVKASSATEGEETTDSSTQVNTAVKVAVQRAQDLERELEAFVVQDEAIKADAAEQAKCMQVRQHPFTIVMRSTLNSTFMSFQAMNEALDSAHLRLKMLASAGDENSSSNSAKPQESLAATFDTCAALWDQLGMPADEREAAVVELQQASSRAHIKIVSDAQEAAAKASDDINRYTIDLAAVCKALGCPVSDYCDEAAIAGETRLLPKIARYESALSDCEAKLKEKGAKLCALKERLLDLVAEMWLDITELPASLQVLMKIMTADAEPVELAHRLEEAHVTLEEGQLSIWEQELRRLNVQRAQTTNKLIAVQKESIALATQMSVLSSLGLQGLMGSKGLGEQVSVQATTGAIELLISPPASNPPGSHSLLHASEMLLLLLKNVRFARANVIGHCKRFLQAFDESCKEEEEKDAKGTSEPVENAKDGAVRGVVVGITSPTEIAYTQDEVMGLIHRVEEMCDRAVEIVPALSGAIIRLTVEMSSGNSGNIDQRLSGLITAPRELPVFALMNEAIAELASMADFVDELWLSSALEDLDCVWSGSSAAEMATWSDSEPRGPAEGDNVCSKEFTRRCIVLRAELSRLTTIHEGLRSLKQLDAQLSRHVTDMEEFEINSKHDRAKLLAGKLSTSQPCPLHR